MSKNKTVNKEKKSWWKEPSTLFGVFLFLFLIFIDQLTKAVADAYFSQPDSPHKIEVIPGWINLCITYNRGISYGMGSGAPTWAKIGVIAGTGVLMAVFAVFFFKIDSRRLWMKMALVCVVAGGVGNLIDRVYYRVWDPTTMYGVRDMVDLSRFGFAVCNFADFFICGGAVALVFGLLFFDKDAIFPMGKYKELAKEAQAEEKAREEAKAAKKAAKNSVETDDENERYDG
jgi:signal peptidase II